VVLSLLSLLTSDTKQCSNRLRGRKNKKTSAAAHTQHSAVTPRSKLDDLAAFEMQALNRKEMFE